MKKITAGRDALREFAPKFAELNDDVLFGEVWSREDRPVSYTHLDPGDTEYLPSGDGGRSAENFY